MLSEALSLELEGLSTLQRKLLVDLMRRKHPQFWSHFTSNEYGWVGAKKSLEGFLQNYSPEFLQELKRFGFNGWEEKGLRRSRIHASRALQKPMERKMQKHRHRSLHTLQG
jgi:hypothetical protein